VHEGGGEDKVAGPPTILFSAGVALQEENLLLPSLFTCHPLLPTTVMSEGLILMRTDLAMNQIARWRYDPTLRRTQNLLSLAGWLGD